MVTIDTQRVKEVLSVVTDPEIPVLTIEDLGILRSVDEEDGHVVVTITPTYSGCPAMGLITGDVKRALRDAGYEDAEVRMSLSPAWTTDWMSEEGKRKLEEFGIAPPGKCMPRTGATPLQITVKCPKCNSLNTKEISRFGSTSCKALYECLDCLEPFDYFKVL